MKRLLIFLATITLVFTSVSPMSCSFAESLSGGENVMTALSDTQRNSIGVLNYIAYLTKEIESQKDNRLYLEEAYSSLYNNTYMNAIDEVTLGQVKSLLTALNNFKMLTVKRERLEYIYEQNQAQAIRDAVPSPIAIMNIVMSGSWHKARLRIGFCPTVRSLNAAVAAASDRWPMSGSWTPKKVLSVMLSAVSVSLGRMNSVSNRFFHHRKRRLTAIRLSLLSGRMRRETFLPGFIPKNRIRSYRSRSGELS